LAHAITPVMKSLDIKTSASWRPWMLVGFPSPYLKDSDPGNWWGNSLQSWKPKNPSSTGVSPKVQRPGSLDFWCHRQHKKSIPALIEPIAICICSLQVCRKLDGAHPRGGQIFLTSSTQLHMLFSSGNILTNTSRNNALCNSYILVNLL
jgi:hypothetical protein